MLNKLYKKWVSFHTKIRQSRSRVSFTLIELIVIISTILTLTAILLPALQSAKNIMYSTACKNNQKQLNILLQAYASDNNEKFPGHYYGPLGAPFPPYHWFAHLALASNVSDEEMFQIYSCPGSRPNDNYTVVHGMNVGAMSAIGQNLRRGGRRANCPEPDRTFLTQDGATDASWLDHFRYNTFMDWGNVSFVDGHVEEFSVDDYAMYDRSIGVTDGGSYFNSKDWTAPLLVDYW